MALADSIHDPQRSTQARELVSPLIDTNQKHLEEIDAIRERWVTRFTDYDSTKQDFQPIYSDLLKKRQVLARKLVDFSLQLRDTMTPEEWSEAHDRIATVLGEN